MISIKIDIDKIAVSAYYEELVNKYTDYVVSTIIGDVDKLYKNIEYSSNRWYLNDFEYSLGAYKNILETQLNSEKIKNNEISAYDSFTYDVSELATNIKAINHHLSYRYDGRGTCKIEKKYFSNEKRDLKEDFRWLYHDYVIKYSDDLDTNITAYINLCKYFNKIPRITTLFKIGRNSNIDDYSKILIIFKTCLIDNKHLIEDEYEDEDIEDIYLYNISEFFNRNCSSIHYYRNSKNEKSLKISLDILNAYNNIHGEIDSFLNLFVSNYQTNELLLNTVYLSNIDIFENLVKDFPNEMKSINNEIYHRYVKSYSKYRIDVEIVNKIVAIYDAKTSTNKSILEKEFLKEIKSEYKDENNIKELNSIYKNFDKNKYDSLLTFDNYCMDNSLGLNMNLLAYKYLDKIVLSHSLLYKHNNQWRDYSSIDMDAHIRNNDRFDDIRKENPLIKNRNYNNGLNYYDERGYSYLLPDIENLFTEKIIPVTVYQLKKLLVDDANKDLINSEIDISNIDKLETSKTFLITNMLADKLKI
jgi:hypothetical protein